MTREEMIADLNTLSDFFAERSNAVPVCLVEAIKILESKQAVVILHKPGQGFGADGKERRA